MTVRVNDKLDIAWQEGLNITRLLLLCHFTSPMLVVRVNDRVIEEEAYETTLVADGDDVRVWHLIGGG